MTIIRPAAVLLLAVAPWVVACASDDDEGAIAPSSTEAETPICTDVLNLADSVAGGLHRPGTLDRAGAVQFDPIDSPVPGVAGLNWLVAAEVDGDVAVWASNGDATFILGVNDHARAVSTWGTAANPGSPVREGVDRIAELDEVDTLVACVQAAP